MLVRLQNDGFRPSAWLSSSLAFYITWNLMQTCSSTWLTGGTKKKLVLYVFLIYYFPFVTNWKIYSWMKSCVIYYLLSCKVYYMNQKKEKASKSYLLPPWHTYAYFLPSTDNADSRRMTLKNIGTTAFWVKMTVKTWCMNFCVNQIKTENISCWLLVYSRHNSKNEGKEGCWLLREYYNKNLISWSHAFLKHLFPHEPSYK